MSERIEISPTVINWAVQRSGLTVNELLKKFPKIENWQTKNKAKLTFVEIEKLSNETHTPMGFFFLDQPPPDEIPLPDFRTIRDKQIASFSADLIDTLNSMQMRQSWYQSYSEDESLPVFKFVGSATLKKSAKAVANEIRELLKLEKGWASRLRSYDDAVSILREKVEATGILIIINGCVGNNTYRILNPEEFRGFVISDKRAPLIFINGQDSKSAQIFTLIHELAHLWVNRSGLFDFSETLIPIDATELYCNKVAAEVLIPEDEINEIWYSYRASDSPFQSLSKHFKVSPIVVGRRLRDLYLITDEIFFNFYNNYLLQDGKMEKKPSGGDFYNNQIYRIGKKFMKVVSRAALEGRITYTDAFRLTGLNNITFDKYLARIGGMY